MDIRYFFARLRVHRLALLVVIVLGAAAADATFFATEPESKAMTGVLVLTPDRATDPAHNPVATINANTVRLASTLAYIARAPQTQQLIAQRFGAAPALIDNAATEPGSRTPLLRVTTRAPTAARAIAAANAVVDQLSLRLNEIQHAVGVRSNSLVRLSTVVSPEAANGSFTARLKSPALAGLVVVLLGIAVIMVMDRRGEGPISCLMTCRR